MTLTYLRSGLMTLLLTLGTSTGAFAQTAEDDDSASTESADRSAAEWGAIASFGAAAVFTALTFGSWAALGCLGDAPPFDICGGESDLTVWRFQVSSALPPDSSTQLDTCDFESVHSATGLTPSDEARGACSAAATWSTLQYVFIGAGLASLAGAVVLMLLDIDGREDRASAAPALTLTPFVGPTGGGVSTVATF